MNTTSFIKEKIEEGKLKLGVCEIKSCGNTDLLYQIKGGFICFTCLETAAALLTKNRDVKNG